MVLRLKLSRLKSGESIRFCSYWQLYQTVSNSNSKQFSKINGIFLKYNLINFKDLHNKYQNNQFRFKNYFCGKVMQQNH